MECVSAVQGDSAVYGIIGFPVSHSFSPILQNTIAAYFGKKLCYVPFPVAPGKLSEAVSGAHALGISGLNVTVPHKQEVISALSGMEKMAAQIGAVNTLKRTESGYFGYNTDILGLESCFSLQGLSLSGKRALVLGAGGAARSAALLAAREGAAFLTLANRTVERARALLAEVQNYYEIPGAAVGLDRLSACPPPEIIIQTTSAGMGKGVWESPVSDGSVFDTCEAVVDIIYTPWETKFLSEARAKGILAVNGFDMLVYQGIASYEIWQECIVLEEDKKRIREICQREYKRRYGNG